MRGSAAMAPSSLKRPAAAPARLDASDAEEDDGLWNSLGGDQAPAEHDHGGEIRDAPDLPLATPPTKQRRLSSGLTQGSHPTHGVCCAALTPGTGPVDPVPFDIQQGGVELNKALLMPVKVAENGRPVSPAPAAVPPRSGVLSPFVRVFGKSPPVRAYWKMMIMLAATVRYPRPVPTSMRGTDQHDRWFRTSSEFEDLSWSEIRAHGRRRWAQYSEGEKEMWNWFAGAFERSAIPVVLKATSAPMPGPLQGLRKDMKGRIRISGVLNTWHGDWGLDDVIVQGLLKQYGDDLEGLCAELAKHPTFVELGKRAEREADRISQLTGFPNYSGSVELCPNSAQVRVHVHMFHSVERARSEVNIKKVWGRFLFYGAPPCDVVPTAGSNPIKAFTRLPEGHFYLQYDKIGVVKQFTNFPKYTRFPVKKKWVLTQFQQYKMTDLAARSEITKCRDGTKHGHLELDYQIAERLKATLQARLDIILSLQESHKLPFVDKPEQVLKFMEQFKGVYGMSRRFKPLVMEGASQFGKSEFMKDLYGAGDTLVVDCENIGKGGEPPLQALEDPRRKRPYKAILFDECSGKTVHKFKMLFQSTATVLMMGCSPTGQYMYPVMLYGLPLLIGTNDFYGGCKKKEKEWLELNIMHVKVTAPLFVRPEASD